MKILFMLLFVSFFMTNQSNAKTNNFEAQSHLSGKVTDLATGNPVPGVSIYFPDLRTGTLTKSDGTYFIGKLPAAKLLVKVSFIGYKLQSRQIDLRSTQTMDFKLEESITEINEVVVTGQSGGVEQNRTPSPVDAISSIQLKQNAGSNLIDAIAHLPGLSQVTTGAGISKPVIRGLGYNRVVVVNDGIRQEGQQWGDEHGIEIDENSASRVEILKGPASLAYGSDAMAGVINIISAPSLPEGSIRGLFSSNYQTNNGLIAYSLNLAGNQNGLVWDARYSQKLAHAYENKYDGPVYNSGFREQALSGLVGINRSWGFSHLNLGWYYLEPGIIEGERDEETGRFVKETEEGETEAVSGDFKSYHPDAPFQKIEHYKAVWDNSIYFGQGRLQATLGFQQNHRKEFEEAEDYGLYFLLNTFNYDIKYRFPEIDDWRFTTGVNGMWQQSKNKGTEFLVPAYHLFDAGVFVVVNKQLGAFDFNGGLRFDQRQEESDPLYLNDEEEIVPLPGEGITERFQAFDRTFSGFSGSLGTSWQISETFFSKLNISRGFRAPNIAELGSNGEHEGTLRYEIGNPELKPETSLQFDWAIGMNTEHVSAELNLFSNYVNHFIYAHKLNTVAGQDSLIDDLPVFKFDANKASLYGAEFKIDIHPHPLDWLHLQNTFSFVNAKMKDQPDSARYLPLTPAPRWIAEIKADINRPVRFLANAYVSFGIDHSWKQDRFYAAYGTETETPGYTLFNAGAGADIVSGKKILCSIYFSAQNLTDQAYQSHLSRLKYAGFNNATGRTGIYNMGRNFSFKLLIPLEVTAEIF